MDDVLFLTGIAVALEMQENGELTTPKGRKRLDALRERLRALRAKIGERMLLTAEESHRKEPAQVP